MSEVVVGLGAAAGATAIAWAWRGRRLHRQARERLHRDVAVDEPAAPAAVSTALRRRRWIPLATGVAAAAALHYVVGMPAVFAVALGAMVLVLGTIVEMHVASRSCLRLEMQLADAIDLMVASLGAGSGLMEALDSAVRESRGLLRRELDQVVGRIRCGEAPQVVYADLAVRVPLETFRLFTFTLAVHGEVGGSLAPALSTVGRTIRDRIEISRRVRAEATQAQASVIGILAITWFLGLMMWRTNPESFERFLAHPVGSGAVAGAMVLQALGLAWITRLSQLRF